MADEIGLRQRPGDGRSEPSAWAANCNAEQRSTAQDVYERCAGPRSAENFNLHNHAHTLHC